MSQDNGAVSDETRAGMTPYGPSHPDYPNAPSDWDGGAYLCRDGGLYYLRGWGWAHGLNCSNPTSEWDRVAYTAQAIDAQSAKTEGLGPKDESAVGTADASK